MGLPPPGYKKTGSNCPRSSFPPIEMATLDGTPVVEPLLHTVKRRDSNMPTIAPRSLVS